MKKIIAVLLVLVMGMAFVACGKKEDSTNAQKVTVAPLTLLETVWNTYEDSEKFPIAGGDMENAVMDAPGAFSLAKVKILS